MNVYFQYVLNVDEFNNNDVQRVQLDFSSLLSAYNLNQPITIDTVHKRTIIGPVKKCLVTKFFRLLSGTAHISEGVPFFTAKNIDTTQTYNGLTICEILITSHIFEVDSS